MFPFAHVFVIRNCGAVASSRNYIEIFVSVKISDCNRRSEQYISCNNVFGPALSAVLPPSDFVRNCIGVHDVQAQIAIDVSDCVDGERRDSCTFAPATSIRPGTNESWLTKCTWFQKF